MENLKRLVTETQIKELNATINEMYKRYNKATKLDALGFEELGSYSEDGLHSLIMLVNNLTELDDNKSEFAKEILLEILTAAQLKSVKREILGNIEYYIKELEEELVGNFETFYKYKDKDYLDDELFEVREFLGYQDVKGAFGYNIVKYEKALYGFYGICIEEFLEDKNDFDTVEWLEELFTNEEEAIDFAISYIKKNY